MMDASVGVLVLCCLLLCAFGSSDALTVTTKTGNVTALVQNNVAIFRGIPYGVAARFSRAKMAAFSPNVIDGSQIPPPCVQPRTNAGVEDCLTIDVYAPASYFSKTAPANLPVLVWIYGGGFIFGSTSNPLSAETDGGNWGFTDQQLALQWVQQNIAAFGGDPNKVTIFGESAGGISVCIHVHSPRSKGLFHAAFIDAGNCGVMSNIAQQQAVSDQFAHAAGCGPSDTLSCLRSKTIDSLMQANAQIDGDRIFGRYGGPMWTPTVDNYILSVMPLISSMMGNITNRVPIAMGCTTGSMRIFMPTGEKMNPQTPQELAETIDFYLSKLPNSTVVVRSEFGFLKNYYTNLDNFGGTIWNAAANFLSDFFFVCGTWRDVSYFARSGVPTYYWMWNHSIPCNPGNASVCLPVPPIFEAFHGSDLGYWFNTTLAPETGGSDLINSMQTLLSTWTKTSNPNPLVGLSSNDPWLPVSNPYSPSPLMLQTPLALAPTYQQSQCELWNRIFVEIQAEGDPFALSDVATIGIVVASLFVAAIISTVAVFAWKNRAIQKQIDLVISTSASKHSVRLENEP